VRYGRSGDISFLARRECSVLAHLSPLFAPPIVRFPVSLNPKRDTRSSHDLSRKRGTIAPSFNVNVNNAHPSLLVIIIIIIIIILRQFAAGMQGGDKRAILDRLGAFRR